MALTEIIPGLKMVDVGLVYQDTLILGDVQLGYEEAMEHQGVLLPRFQLQDILKELDSIFAQVKVKKVIINGDIKHEFGTITNQEWRDALRFFDYLFEKMGEKGELILIKGNHDLVLDPIAQKRNIKIVDVYHVDNISVLHGHRIILGLRDIIIIGHEHPAISFSERREEKFKCFLKGTWKGKTLIVQPSLTQIHAGSDVLREQYLSPFLKDGVENFEVWVLADTTRYFGKVKDIREL
jgi:putative SbcD/Mre11-related phosphoesterase